MNRTKNPLRVAATGLATLAVVGSGLWLNPALAVDAPQATTDFFYMDGRGEVSGNVLANDTWAPEESVEVVDVRVVPWNIVGEVMYDPGFGPIAFDPSRPWPSSTVADLTWDASGAVTLDFGPYTSDDYPSLVRRARVAYTIQDSLGQRSESIAVFVDTPSTADPLVAEDDDLASWDRTSTVGQETTETDWRPLGHLLLSNDRFSYPVSPDGVQGVHEAMRVEVVTPPQHHTVHPDPYNGTAWDIHVAPTAEFLSETRDRVADSMEYRFCIQDRCSDTATATWYTSVIEPRPHVPEVVQDLTWWENGPTEHTFALGDLPTFGEDDWYAEGHTPQLEYDGSNETVSAALDTENETLTLRLVGNPESLPTPEAPLHLATVAWLDEVGEVVGRTYIRTDYLPHLPLGEMAEFGSDTGWVPVGGDTVIMTGENNAWDSPWWYGGDLALFAGENESRYGTSVEPTLAGGDLAEHVERASVGGPVQGGVDAIRYRAGNETGTDTVTIEHCSAYPADPQRVTCLNETVTVHVTPRVAAEDDATVTDPGTPVDVDVLANDVFTDITTDGYNVPDPRTARLTVMEGSLPDGVTATVTPQREVRVVAPARYEGQTFSFTYGLADFTGSATADVTVEVLAGEEPPPPPVADAPDARDDVLSVLEGDAASVDVLGNDDYTDPATVILIDDAPEGMTADLAADGGLAVTVVEGYEGSETVRLGYGLDDIGGSDTATVTVNVEMLPEDEPPAVKGPTARDDRESLQTGKPTPVKVLANDRYTGKPKVQVITDSLPKGVRAKVDDKGRVVVTVDRSQAGKPLSFRYRLTDKTGKSDTARVTVVTPPVIVTGAERDLPTTAAASPAAVQESVEQSRWLGAGLVAAGIALLGAAVSRRRRVTA